MKNRSIVKTMPSAALFVFILASIVWLNMAFGADQEPMVLDWDDLRVKVSIDDPFKDLTTEQLKKISTYERTATLQKRDPEAVSEEEAEEAEEARSWLIEQGIDVEEILAKREEIKRLRHRRANSTNPRGLDG